MTLREKLDRYPPCLMRLLARRPNGEAMSAAEIHERMKAAAQLSGDIWHVLHHLSYSIGWDNHRIDHLWLWMHATGCDLEDRETYRRLSRYMNPARDTKFAHLKRSDEWPELKKILTVYLDSL